MAETVPATAKRPGNRLMDRPEYKMKQQPLTCAPDTSVFEAVTQMAAKNFGSVIVVDAQKKVIGIVTERDVMNKLVANQLDAHTTTLADIMTENPRLARETDDLIDWLRIMSNERFRRLPVVDDQGHIKAVFTQGDFVSYTWPDLMYQMKSIATATVTKNFPLFLIGGGVAVYSLIMVVVLGNLN
jgi:CBS domain-containing protein